MFSCNDCGYTAAADFVAARNIRAAAPRLVNQGSLSSPLCYRVREAVGVDGSVTSSYLEDHGSDLEDHAPATHACSAMARINTNVGTSSNPIGRPADDSRAALHAPFAETHPGNRQSATEHAR
jgi:hypothetical protein